MRTSTLKVRAKSLSVTNEVANDIRNGKRYIIQPLLSRNLIKAGDYYYLRERLNDGTYTTKDTALTFIRIMSSKVVSINNLLDSDIDALEVPNNDLETYYNNLINVIANDRAKTVNSMNRMLRGYNYNNNPTIEFIEVDIVEPNDIEK
jgi:hypothetical protein